jgi:hypothetical protein
MRDVTFGPESYDEMMIGFADYIVDEGLRPSVDVPDPMIAKLDELKSLYPGDIYTMKVPAGPGGEWRESALVLPREGDGGWYISLGSFVGRASIEEIAWMNDGFEAKALIPGQGTTRLRGRLNEEKGILQLVIAGEGQSAMPAQAKRVE